MSYVISLFDVESEFPCEVSVICHNGADDCMELFFTVNQALWITHQELQILRVDLWASKPVDKVTDTIVKYLNKNNVVVLECDAAGIRNVVDNFISSHYMMK